MNSTYELKDMNIKISQLISLLAGNKIVNVSRTHHGKREIINFTFFDTPSKDLLLSNRYLMIKSVMPIYLGGSNKTTLVYCDQNKIIQTVNILEDIDIAPELFDFDNYLIQLNGTLLRAKDLSPALEVHMTKDTLFLNFDSLRSRIEGHPLKLDAGLHDMNIYAVNGKETEKHVLLLELKNVTKKYDDNRINKSLKDEESIAFKSFDNAMTIGNGLLGTSAAHYVPKMFTPIKVKGNLYAYLASKFPEFASGSAENQNQM